MSNISNDVLSEAIQHKGSSYQSGGSSGHYVPYSFSDSGSANNWINDTKIQWYKLLKLSFSDCFNDF